MRWGGLGRLGRGDFTESVCLLVFGFVILHFGFQKVDRSRLLKLETFWILVLEKTDALRMQRPDVRRIIEEFILTWQARPKAERVSRSPAGTEASDKILGDV